MVGETKLNLIYKIERILLSSREFYNLLQTQVHGYVKESLSGSIWVVCAGDSMVCPIHTWDIEVTYNNKNCLFELGFQSTEFLLDTIKVRVVYVIRGAIV